MHPACVVRHTRMRPHSPPAAQRLREQYASKARGLGEELLRLQERHASLEEAAGELREENRVAEREVQRMEERHQLMRDELEAEVNGNRDCDGAWR